MTNEEKELVRELIQRYEQRYRSWNATDASIVWDIKEKLGLNEVEDEEV